MGGRGGEGGSRAKPGNQLVYIYICIAYYIDVLFKSDIGALFKRMQVRVAVNWKRQL